MSLVLVQGDTAPTLRGTLTDDETGNPLDLTGATVFFQMRKKDDHRYTINAQCTLLTPSAGTVSYQLAANDLNTAGDYLAQFEVRYPDLRVQTTVTQIPVTVRRQ
jgi:hypothetical protein